MTITLPDEWRGELEAQARADGFASVDQYVQSLVHDAAIDGDEAADEPAVLTREELESKLIASLDSGPPILADAEFWANLRRKVAAHTLRQPGT